VPCVIATDSSELAGKRGAAVLLVAHTLSDVAACDEVHRVGGGVRRGALLSPRWALCSLRAARELACDSFKLRYVEKVLKGSGSC